MLLAPAETTIDRFQRRGHPIDQVVEALGGAAVIRRIHTHLAAYLPPESTVIQTDGRDAAQTYRTLIAALSESPGIVRPAE